MRNALADAVIDRDEAAFRFERTFHGLLKLLGGTNQRGYLRHRQIRQCLNVARRNQENMAREHRAMVEEGQCGLTAPDNIRRDLTGRDIAKNTAHYSADRELRKRCAKSSIRST